jgi:ABC-type transport system involved in multi-copper enzyme maturation permease subunit
MYLTCIKKELLHSILSYRYLLVFFLFVFMGLVTTAVRTSLYQKAAVEYSKAGHEQAKLNEMVRYVIQQSAQSIQKPPNPLSIFAAGLEPEMTRSFSIAELGSTPKVGERKLNQPSIQYHLPLDMVLIINIVCSLLAMLLVFDGVCGEREAGTLKVLLSGPLPRDVIIVSKLVAGLVTIILPLLITWALSIGYAMVAGGIVFSADQLSRLALIVCLSTASIAFYFALGIAVSSWVQRSATALAICLFCWIMFVLAIPNLVPVVVNSFAPIPAQSKILKEREAVFNYVSNELMPVWRNEAGEEAKFKTVEALMDSLYRRRDAEVASRTEGMERFYDNLVNRQLVLDQSISRISPASSFLYAVTHIAGTGAPDFIDLISAIGEHRQAIDRVNRAQNDRMQEEMRTHPDVIPFLRKHAYDPSLFPVFRPRNASLDKAVNDCWPDMVLLLGGAVLLFMVSFVGFVRYDPR